MPITAHQQELGRPCPDFSLISVTNDPFSLHSFDKSNALLIAFICSHCPYVRAIEDRLIALSKSYPVEQLQVVGICSNDWHVYPEDAPDELLKRWREKDYGFPYLVDENQEVARKFNAACTPDLFLYDKNRRLYYHGELDNNWKDPSHVTRHSMREAVEALLASKPAPKDQKLPIGCSIKWKAPV